MAGRRGQLLDQLLGEVGAGRALVVHGPAGVGRSWLLRAVATSLESAGEQARLIRGLELLAEEAGFAACWAAGGPVAGADDLAAALGGAALLVDDIEWVDDASLAMIGDLAAGATAPVLATLASTHPLASARRARLEEAGFAAVELPPLGEDEAAELARSVLASEPDHAQAIALAGGVPALLLAGPGTLDGAAAACVHAWLDALPVGARRAAALLHLAGGALDAVPASVGEDDLAALARAGVAAVTRAGTRAGACAGARLLVGHIGRSAAASWPDAAELHRSLAEVRPPEEAAHHLAAAGDHERAHRCALDALEGLGGLEPSDPAARHAGSATRRAALLDLAVATTTAPAPALLRAAAAALLAAGRPAPAAALAARAGDLGLELAAHRQRGASAAAADLAAASRAAVGPPSPIELAERHRLARWPGGTGPAAPAGPPPRDAEALDSLLEGGDAGSAADALDRLLGDACWDAAATVGAALVARHLVTGAAGVEPARAAAAALASGLASAPVGPWHRTAQLAAGVAASWADGRPPADEAALGPLVAVEHPGAPVALGWFALALADAGRASDALAALAAGTDAGAVGGEQVLLAWARAEVELVAGRPRRATASAPAALQPAALAPLSGPLAVIEAWAAIEVGEPRPHGPHPHWPSSREQPRHGQPGTSGAAAAEVAGVAALAAGEHETAAARFDQAAATWGWARAVRRCRWAAAEARRRADDPAAVAALRVLEAESEAAGALPLLARVRQSLRRAGVRARAAGASGGGARDSRSLSPREDEVLRLVGAGLSSAEIATRLGIGRATVDTQVASAMRKLGARTRRQAAAMLLERAG